MPSQTPRKYLKANRDRDLTREKDPHPPPARHEDNHQRAVACVPKRERKEREKDQTGQPLPYQDPFGALIFILFFCSGASRRMRWRASSQVPS